MEKNPSLQVPPEETNLVLKTPKKAKETKKSSIKELKQHTNAPMGLRTAYMIFLRMETERLKMIHGKGSPGQIKNMANDAWKRLSEHDRQVYFSFISKNVILQNSYKKLNLSIWDVLKHAQ